MAKKVLLGVAVVAVLSTGYFVIKGWPPSQDGAQGTINAAKRYHTEQIANGDVALQNPEVQQLMQTDFFHRMVTDKNFQHMVASGTLEKLYSGHTNGMAAFS